MQVLPLQRTSKFFISKQNFVYFSKKPLSTWHISFEEKQEYPCQKKKKVIVFG